MNLFNELRGFILQALEALTKEGKLPEGLDSKAVAVEPPKDASHGELATNAAMVIAKPAGKNPREIADLLIEKLKALPHIVHADIAGPGFINLTLKPSAWQSILRTVLNENSSYGNSTLGQGQKINVEYVSANPTGPMHIGHARGAVFGDALCLLLMKAGYNVTKEYYINDAGAQIDTLARSAFLRYREALGETIQIPEGLYPGEYLKAAGEAIKHKYHSTLLAKPEKEWLPIVREMAVESMLIMIRQDLADLGIVHDIFTSERKIQLAGRIEEALKLLDNKGLIYKGVLEAPKGKAPEDWEPREQTLFRSTQFGDDIDRPVQKSDGSWTYFASDIAYHLDKYERGFNHMMVSLGTDHGGYVKRLKAAVQAVSDKKATVDVKLHAIVNFMENGIPLKMSKRKGTFTTVRDVLEAVGKDVIRFIMLTRKNDAVLDFDLAKVTEQSRDNPVFYVQYAHARCHSVLRQAGLEPSLDYLDRLNSPAELDLIKKIAEWPRVVETAATHKEPHRIAFYLQELAAAFHSLWNQGKEDESLRFIIEGDEPLTRARLALVKASAITIASGLFVLGVEPVREM